MPVPAISKRFGIAVRKARIAAAITQEVLAERAGLHATYVGMIERGLRNPTLDVAARLAKGLRISLTDLIADAIAEKSARGRKS